MDGERIESKLMQAHNSEVLTDEQSNPLSGITKNNMSEEAVSGGIIKRRQGNMNKKAKNGDTDDSGHNKDI